MALQKQMHFLVGKVSESNYDFNSNSSLEATFFVLLFLKKTLQIYLMTQLLVICLENKMILVEAKLLSFSKHL